MRWASVRTRRRGEVEGGVRNYSGSYIISRWSISNFYGGDAGIILTMDDGR